MKNKKFRDAILMVEQPVSLKNIAKELKKKEGPSSFRERWKRERRNEIAKRLKKVFLSNGSQKYGFPISMGRGAGAETAGYLKLSDMLKIFKELSQELKAAGFVSKVEKTFNYYEGESKKLDGKKYAQARITIYGLNQGE